MEKQKTLRTLLLFHHGKKDSPYVEKKIHGLRGGEHCIILSTDPLSLGLKMITEDDYNPEMDYSFVTEVYKLTVINTRLVRSSNHMFVKIKGAIESYNDNFGRGIELIIDLTTADKLDTFTASKISSLYPTTVEDNDSKDIIEPMPPHVVLSEREQNLLIFYYDKQRLFSKKEVLEDIDDYNPNKYQISKEKLENTGQIRLMKPPVDRDYSVGKNPDYFMVTFSGYYNALINKRCTALQEEIYSKGPIRFREERYQHLYDTSNPYVEYGEIDLEKNEVNPYLNFSN